MQSFTFPLALALLAATMSANAWHWSGGSPGERFDRADKDSDGLITLAEFKALSPEDFQHRREGFFSQLDANEDGSLTLEELQTGANEKFQAMQERMASRHAKRTAKMQERFAAADANADGMVTSDELREAVFSRLDANEDGYIDGDEAEAAWEAGHGKRRHGRRHR